MVNKPGFRLLIICLLGLMSGHVSRADEPLTSRQERIENMTADQKEQLLQRYKQFQAFKPEERERLRNLHRDLENDPHCDDLRRVMDRYYDWLKTLSSYQLMELRRLSPEERVERIKTLQQEERLPGRGRGRFGYGRFGPGFDRLGTMADEIDPRDREALLNWTADYAARCEKAFTENLSDSVRKKLEQELAGIDAPRDRLQFLFWRMWLRRQLDDPEKPLPDLDDQWPRLLAALSPQMREALESLPKNEQLATIAGKIRILALEHYFAHRPGSVPSVITEEELAAYFTNLDQGRQSWLQGLPSADLQRWVWRLYLLSKLPGMPQGFPSIGPGGARRPGPQRYGPPQKGGGIRPDPGRPGPSAGSRLGPEAPPPRLGDPPNRADKPLRRSENGGQDPR